MSKPNPMGATFAERAAAAKGDKSFDDPTPAAVENEENSTFGSRSKAVSGVDAENKAVGSKKTKRKRA